MAYGNKEFNYETDENKESYIIEEKGNSYTQLAYERWNEDSDFKLALRKFYSSAKGETAGKGVTFMTEEGPSELINALLKEGYGNPDDIAKVCIEDRPDIIGSIVYNHSHNSESDEDGNYYVIFCTLSNLSSEMQGMCRYSYQSDIPESSAHCHSHE